MKIKIVKVQHYKLVPQVYQEYNSQSITTIQNTSWYQHKQLTNGECKTLTMGGEIPSTKLR